MLRRGRRGFEGLWRNGSLEQDFPDQYKQKDGAYPEPGPCRAMSVLHHIWGKDGAFRSRGFTVFANHVFPAFFSAFRGLCSPRMIARHLLIKSFDSAIRRLDLS